MDSSTPEIIEVCQLVQNFFPESKATIQSDQRFSIYDLITAMSWGDGYRADFSCEPVPYLENPPDLGLAELGGVWDDDDTIYNRLLQHSGFSPSGRVVIFPDDAPCEGREPFVCHSRSAVDRIREFKSGFFDNCGDIMFVYESGEAMALDHDQRFFWSKSKLRVWT